MSTAPELEGAPSLFVPAVVIAVGAHEVGVRTDAGVQLAATIACGPTYSARIGDRLLVAVDGDRAWAIGILAALREAEPRELQANDGTKAALEGDALVVRDAEGSELFRHRPGVGHEVRLRGDLSLKTEGHLSFAAAEGISLRAGDGEGGGGAALSLEGERFSFEASELEGRADHARLALIEAVFVSERLTTAVERARHVVGVAEVEAGRLIERARESFREVEGLAQTQVGRMRTLVQDTFHLRADRVALRGEQEVAIDGRRIELG